MTATLPATPDARRAADLDVAHVAWSAYPPAHRPTLGTFTVNYLRARGVELVPADPVAPPLATDRQLADLLAALAERGLRWIPGEHGECGTLLDGPAEPPDLHVVFGAFRSAWQRDDDRARDEGDPCARWFGPIGIRNTWAELQRIHGPLAPDGGIAPPAGGSA